VGGIVTGDDEQAAGLLVEPMDYAGALRIRTASENLGQLVDKGGANVGWGRVDDEASGLVDHGEVLVEVDEA
jgi:hypothetical protein